MTEQFDITKDAILVRVVIRQGQQTASSKVLRDEAVEKHGADRKSYKAGVQIILPEDKAEIQAVISAVQAVYRRNTLPWEDGAYRLLPLTHRDALKEELTGLQSKFNTAVEEMLERYDVLKRDYERRISDIADEIPFPSRETMREGYGMEVRELPIPNTSDVRLRHVSTQALEEIKTRLDQQISARLMEAQGDIVARLIDLVERLEKQCLEGKRFSEVLISNIQDAVGLLPALNLTGDKEINRLIQLVNTNLCTLEVDDLKDEKSRANVAKMAGSVLDELRYWTIDREV